MGYRLGRVRKSRQKDDVNYVDIKGEGTMELSDGVLHLRWNQGTCVGIAEAKAVLEAIATLGQGARLPMLVDILGVTHSPAARKVFPDPSAVSRMALLGLSLVDRVVASFRLPLLPIGFPVKPRKLWCGCASKRRSPERSRGAPGRQRHPGQL